MDNTGFLIHAHIHVLETAASLVLVSFQPKHLSAPFKHIPLGESYMA